MISAFDIFSVGLGPSSSHTVGPMRAAQQFAKSLAQRELLTSCDSVRVDLYGSLAQTGVGHGTDKAVLLGLMGYLPDQVDPAIVEGLMSQVKLEQQLRLLGDHSIAFDIERNLLMHAFESLPGHANGMRLRAFNGSQELAGEVYYSVGGGFVLTEAELQAQLQGSTATDSKPPEKAVPYRFNSAEELMRLCEEQGLSISSLMLANECSLQAREQIETRLWSLWQTMDDCIERGFNTEGILPGGLKVKRRAPELLRKLSVVKDEDPLLTMDWVNLYALAVNEENAGGGRVVTAPTNGAAGVIPAVIRYYDKFVRPLGQESCRRFLLSAAAIGSLYKKNASISGAEVGCQGEVGVACSMAAAGLTEIMGGTVEQVEHAAEIAMEHNLGLTCDPVGGLVQVPCIERNAMGAIKAINASRMALRGSGEHKVSLDKVIKTMWETGNDMKAKYKETAQGGLAVNIIEC